MTTFTIPVRIGKRDALYTVLAADKRTAQDHVRQDVAEHYGPQQSVMFT